MAVIVAPARYVLPPAFIRRGASPSLWLGAAFQAFYVAARRNLPKRPAFLLARHRPPGVKGRRVGPKAHLYVASRRVRRRRMNVAEDSAFLGR
jgi:hypothetical protein